MARNIKLLKLESRSANHLRIYVGEQFEDPSKEAPRSVRGRDRLHEREGLIQECNTATRSIGRLWRRLASDMGNVIVT